MHRRSFNPIFWTLANVGSRVRFTPRIAKSLTTAVLPATTPLAIPTRHGTLRAILIRPRPADAAAAPPVIMHMHGGGFLNRYPEQDIHLARYLAARLSAVVVLPDYSTAPAVSYPVAEEEMYDVARWIQASGAAHGWDGSRLLLSGISAGSKLVINVCQQIDALGGLRPLAVSLTVPVTDLSRTDRTSSIPKPAISPFIQRLVGWAYVPDVERRREPLASPRYDASLPEAMPPTLIQSGEYDTLAAEARELAHLLQTAGVEVVYQQYPGADHDFYASKPIERVSQLLAEITAFFAAQLAATTTKELT